MSDSPIVADVRSPAVDRPDLLDGWCRGIVFRMLERVKGAQIIVREGDQSFSFGSGDADGLRATVHVRSPRFYRRVALGGNAGVGKAFGDGLWTCSDLTTLIRIFARQLELIEAASSGWSRVTAPLNAMYHWLRKNTRTGSRKNISAHYDVGNDFFALVLDPTMSYSCAMFDDDDSTLEEASVAKNDWICRKLDLSPEHHLLEIGTGWGGLAVHAAKHYGCRVTTTTISREQHDYARERIREAGLDSRVELLLRDYRELSGSYDRLVSVEMIEAVGHHYLDRFFRKCGSLLSRDGLMLLQSITIRDHRYETARRRVDFIKRYIFPGSCIPSVARLGAAVADATQMQIIDLEDITPHYARTLRVWRERMLENADDIRSLGYSDEFLRMWEYYFAYCEAGFAERYIGDVHMLLSQPGYVMNPNQPVARRTVTDVR